MRFNVRKVLILTAYLAAVLALLSSVGVHVTDTNSWPPIVFLFVAAIAWIYEFARAD